jgi:hypothetical protein
MTPLSSANPSPHQSRTLPKATISPAELRDRKQQRSETGKLCREIFERIRSKLIENHYNWFIAIDADTGNYLLDAQLQGLLQQVRNDYTNPDAKLTIFRLNETGACGKI